MMSCPGFPECPTCFYLRTRLIRCDNAIADEVAAARLEERARIVAWLRSMNDVDHPNYADCGDPLIAETIAGMIEAGEHVKEGGK